MEEFEGKVVSCEREFGGITKVGLQRPMEAGPVPDGSHIISMGASTTRFVYFWPDQPVPEKDELVKLWASEHFSWLRFRTLTRARRLKRVSEIAPSGRIEIIQLEDGVEAAYAHAH